MQFPSQSNQSLELDTMPARINDHSNKKEKTKQGKSATNHMEFEEELISSTTLPSSNHLSTSKSILEEQGGSGGGEESNGGHMYLTANVNGVDYQSEV